MAKAAFACALKASRPKAPGGGRGALTVLPNFFVSAPSFCNISFISSNFVDSKKEASSIVEDFGCISFSLLAGELGAALYLI